MNRNEFELQFENIIDDATNELSSNEFIKFIFDIKERAEEIISDNGYEKD